MPPRDSHVRHLDVSSFLGPASMVERRIGSATRRRGASGGEFLQQGFAYTQSGGREREEGSRAARVGGGGVGGGCAPSPLYIEGWAASPCYSPNYQGKWCFIKVGSYRWYQSTELPVGL